MEEEEKKPETLEEKRQRIAAEEQELRDLQLENEGRKKRQTDKYQWEQTVFKDSDDTTTDYLEIEITHHDDRIYTVTNLVAVDVDKAPNSVRLFNVKAGQKHWLAAIKPSAACIALTYTGEIITSTGQKMRAEFWNTDTGNDLFFTVSGYWSKR